MGDIVVCGIGVVDAIARPIDAFPAPGGLRLFDELSWTTGGCAINAAIALARLGERPRLVARVGADLLGDFVIAELARAGLDTGGVARDADLPTSFSLVAVASGGERSFLHIKGANAALREDDVGDGVLRGASEVFVTGAMLMDALDGEPTARVLARAREAGARTLLDTVYVEGVEGAEWRRRVLPALAHADFFVPSLAEAAAIAGTDDAWAAAREFRRHGAREVVVKLGARGVLCVDVKGVETLVPAARVGRVVDATGAGDCWSAGFIAGLRRGRSLVEAAGVGNRVAALSVAAAGATEGLRDSAAIAGVWGSGEVG